jgi:glutathione S-transferase
MSSALILHHYEISPFSEKIRRILAYKKQPWTAVRAPAVMPKPDLVSLTGGYRKIPVLQIGNHVYLDTALITREIERLCPTPPLYSPAIAESLAEWADTRLFESAMPHVMRPSRLDDLLRWLTQDELGMLADDRRAMRLDAAKPAESSKSLLAHFRRYLLRIEQSLAHGPYLLGSAPTLADFSVYHSLWLISRVKPEALAEAPHTRAFIERLSAIPDPEITQISAIEALEISKQSDPAWQPSAAWSDPTGFTPGQSLAIRAGDYGRDPVHGNLVYADDTQLVLHRHDARAGDVYVHTPRAGYEIAAN